MDAKGNNIIACFGCRNNSSPSVWVTAYCARVFTEATFNEWENFLYIDHNVNLHTLLTHLPLN